MQERKEEIEFANGNVTENDQLSEERGLAVLSRWCPMQGNATWT